MSSAASATGGLGVPLVSLGVVTGGVEAPATAPSGCVESSLCVVSLSGSLSLSGYSATLSVEGGRGATLATCP